MAELDSLLGKWHTDLAAWAIPDSILASVPESPWVSPRQVFARRADRLADQPGGPSFERAWAALDPPGSLLDVGSGPGAACLPLIPRCTGLTAVDSDPGMLALLAERAARLGLSPRCVTGTWPMIADEVSPFDVVTCHHVLYNVSDLKTFVTALTDHARRLVVVELTATHPLTSLNQLWLRFHGLTRPAGPTAAEAVDILRAMGLAVDVQRWRRPGGPDYRSFDELVDVTRRRLCLPRDHAAEVASALIELGVDPNHPLDLGSSGRDVVTVWWRGTAASASEATRMPRSNRG